MRKEAASRLEVFERLAQLTQDYLLMLSQVEQWDEAAYEQYAREWEILQQAAEALPQAEDELEREQEVALCQSLIVLTQSLFHRIERLQNLLGTEVHGVRQNKTIVNAYYGLGRVDQTAVYLDEKK